MKKKILLLISFVLIFSMFAALPTVAEESDLYYVNVPILKIFPHTLGYYVIYRRAGLKTGETYIPQAWFDRRDQRAVLILTEDDSEPYLTIVMKKGEFDHVRVHAKKNPNNSSWGFISPGTDFGDKFKVEKLNLEF